MQKSQNCSGGASSGGASAVKEQVISRSENPQAKSPGVIKGVAMQDFYLGCTFSSKTFLVVAVKTQAANAVDCVTVKIKQIKRSDILTFLFSVHTITEAKQ